MQRSAVPAKSIVGGEVQVAPWSAAGPVTSLGSWVMNVRS